MIRCWFGIGFSVGQEPAAENKNGDYATAAANAVAFSAGTVAGGEGKGGPEAPTAADISAINSDANACLQSSVSEDKQGNLDFFEPSFVKCFHFEWGTRCLGNCWSDFYIKKASLSRPGESSYTSALTGQKVLHPPIGATIMSEKGTFVCGQLNVALI